MGPADNGKKEQLLVDFRAAGGGKWNLFPNQISRQKPVCCRPGFHSLSIVKIVRSDRVEIPRLLGMRDILGVRARSPRFGLYDVILAFI